MSVPASPSNDPRAAGRPNNSAPPKPPDQIVEELTRLWQSGGRPDVFAYLQAIGPLPVSRLVAVLEADQNERGRAAQVLCTEAYFDTFPQLNGHPQAFALVLGDMYLRQTAGEVVSLDDYRRRFPAFAGKLGLLGDPADSTQSDLGVMETTFPVATPAPAELPAAPESVATLRLRPDWAAQAAGGPEPPDAPPPESAVQPAAQRVGQYEIRSVLARGGMGVVYLAYDAQLKRSVALKMVLAGQHADESSLARFRGEAAAVGRLQHPNIVQVYQVGEHDGLPFLALEYVDGPSLSQLLGGKPLPPARAAALARTVARAIDFAHQRGIVHRDLKPGNVLLDSTGQPKITDFGVAKLRHERDTPTQPGEVIGTPNYMAPEQAEGTRGGVGPAADVYSLGAVLYEMLTGQPPFAGGSPMETLLRVRLSEPLRPTYYEPAVPRDLETICLKCLRKDRHQRYAAAAALADDLDRFLDGKPVLARPVSTSERAWKWARRHPAGALMAAALAAVMIVAFALVVVQWRAADEARRTATRRNAELLQAQETLTEEKRRTEAAGERNDRLFYTHLLASADRDWLMHDAAGAVQDLDACSPALRGWEWRLLRRQVEGARLTAPAPPLTALTVLPGDREFAGLAPDGVLHVWDVATAGQLRQQPLQRGPDFPPAWLFSRSAFSPDGRLLAAVCHSQESAPRTCRVGVWRVGTGELVRSWESPAALVMRLAFNPAGTRLAWSSGTWQENRGQATWTGGEVRVLNPATGATTLRLDSGEFSYPDLTFSPDGKWLATTGRHVALFVFDAQTGAEAFRLDEPNFLGRGLVYQDGGRRILVHRDHELTVFTSGGERLTPVNRDRGGIDRLFVSPDATRLATADSLNTVRVFDTGATQELAHLAGHTRWVTLAAFTADNRRLITFSQDGHLKVWDLNREPGPRTLGRGDIVPGEWVPCAVFDRSGGRLYTASDKKLIRVFDTQTGEKLFTLTAAYEIRSLALSPDGQRLVVGYDNVNGQIGVWDLASRREAVWPAGHRDCLTCVVYSADGSRLATAGQDGTAKVWEAATGRLITDLRGHAGYVNYVAFHPDGRQVVTAGEDGTVRFWDARTGQPLKTLAAHETAVTTVVFSPDGKEMATANHNRDRPTAATQIHLWDVATGERRATLTGHHQSIWHLAYSPDGSRLVSAGEDHTVRVWDPAFGEPRLTLKWHGDDVRYVAFSPDGRLLVSCGDDPFIRLWDATPIQ